LISTTLNNYDNIVNIILIADQGASSDSEAAKPIPSLPNLHQLVPGGSGVDLLLEADSKEKIQPIVNSVDNLQEILAAATASLEGEINLISRHGSRMIQHKNLVSTIFDSQNPLLYIFHIHAI
jgi:hypothetical protein